MLPERLLLSADGRSITRRAVERRAGVKGGSEGRRALELRLKLTQEPIKSILDWVPIASFGLRLGEDGHSRIADWREGMLLETC